MGTIATDEAVEIVYTDACVGGLHALRKDDKEGAEKWYALANLIEDQYPAVVQAIRDRMRPPLPAA
jgi:hypothetical protein